MRKEVKDWLEQAEAELKTSKDLVATENYYAAAFHAQQCAEMALKATFIFLRKAEPPRTHSLFDLAKGVNLPGDLMDAIRFLNPEYTISRYPDVAGGPPVKLYDRSLALDKIKRAEEVLKWVNSKIQR